MFENKYNSLRIIRRTHLPNDTIDQLNRKVHINHLCGNLTKILSAFKLFKRLIPDKFKRDLYYAYCFSRITYGIEVYGTEFLKHYTIRTGIPLPVFYIKILTFYK